ncbi:MAG: PQQ-binding-like beta-propeller repeat protein [Polyangiales bacterium]
MTVATRRKLAALVLGGGVALAALSCGAGGAGVDYGYFDKTSRPSSGAALRVRWTKPLAPEFSGAYVPVEHAAAALDPRHERLYVGSSQRTLWAFDTGGRALWTYQAESSIEAEPTLDPMRDELYVATAAGHVHALSAYDGKKRFDVNLEVAISQPGILSDDALYLVTDSDAVFALSRKDGSVLWRYQRDPRTGLKITGHAGLLSADQRLITGFSDGSIVALAKGDGRALWVVDTTLDLTDTAQADIGFVDVDTTPVLVGDTVYAASFLAGVYALRVQDGVTLTRHAELGGITSLAGDERTITMVSAEHGVVCYDLPALTVRWTRNQHIRGAANYVKLRDRTLFVTESRGALLAIAVADGRELGRLQTTHGFAAEPTISEGRGAILGNSGVVYAFDY